MMQDKQAKHTKPSQTGLSSVDNSKLYPHLHVKQFSKRLLFPISPLAIVMQGEHQAIASHLPETKGIL